MEKIIGYCGIICSECPVFLATQKDDDEKRRMVAEMFTKQYGREYKAEDINCKGCTSDSSQIFHYCETCEIRKCARERKIENCAYCTDYPCENLSKIFASYPKAKETLDSIKYGTS